MLTNDIQGNLDVSAGILIFNPLDDPYHLERIERDICSIADAAIYSKHSIHLMLCPNMSPVLGTDNPNTVGVGDKTRALITKLSTQYNLPIHNYTGDNGAAKGYRFIQEYLYTKTKGKNIVVFADDYIMPTEWFDKMMDNMDKHPEFSFMVPSTSFVCQEQLTEDIEIDYHPDWDVRVAPKGDHKKWGYKTIYGGVTVDHINDLYKKHAHLPVIQFWGAPSFETTIFNREYMDEIGLIHERYYSQWYDNDYFMLGFNKGKIGGIAKNAFIFHYGKGGTKALYKDTADQKYQESPVIHFMENDIKVWNERWGQNRESQWGSAPDAKVGGSTND